jgi:RNA polymerase sigma-70 factor (ECF subfamily)
VELANETAILYRQVVNLISGEFPSKYWAAFQGLVVDGRSAQEIADDLQITVNVVYQAKSRILARIRGEFARLVS